jgi:hypothetical protein
MVKNLSYYVVNDKGYYGEYLFNNKHNPLNEIKTININELDDEKEKLIIIKHPTWQELLMNIDKLKNFHVIIFLDITQKKEIDFIDNYFSKLPLNISFKTIKHGFDNQVSAFDFLNIQDFNSEELKTISKTKQEFKLLYIYKNLKEELNLNASKLRNFNVNPLITFSFEDFKHLDKNKFPKSYALLKSNNFEYFYQMLYSELTKIRDFELEILMKFEDSSGEKKTISTERFTKDELIAVKQLIKKGEIINNGNYFISKL